MTIQYIKTEQWTEERFDQNQKAFDIEVRRCRDEFISKQEKSFFNWFIKTYNCEGVTAIA